MARSSIAVAFAGSGGSGAMTAGAVFVRAAARAGYYGMMMERAFSRRADAKSADGGADADS